MNFVADPVQAFGEAMEFTVPSRTVVDELVHSNAFRVYEAALASGSSEVDAIDAARAKSPLEVVDESTRVPGGPLHETLVLEPNSVVLVTWSSTK